MYMRLNGLGFWDDFSLPDFGSSSWVPESGTLPEVSVTADVPQSSSNWFSDMDFSWLKDLTAGAVKTYGEIQLIDAKKDAAINQARIQNGLNPYGSSLYPSGSANLPGLSYPSGSYPYPQYGTTGAGISTPVIIGAAALIGGLVLLSRRS